MIKSREELEQFGFIIQDANKKKGNGQERLFATKGDLTYLSCNKCGDNHYKPIDSFGLSSHSFMKKQNHCKTCKCKLTKKYTLNRPFVISRSKETHDFVTEKQIVCKIEPIKGKYKIMYMVGNSYIWELALRKEFDHISQARLQITETLTGYLSLREEMTTLY